jgi:hypothetical protein
MNNQETKSAHGQEAEHNAKRDLEWSSNGLHLTMRGNRSRRDDHHLGHPLRRHLRDRSCGRGGDCGKRGGAQRDRVCSGLRVLEMCRLSDRRKKRLLRLRDRTRFGILHWWWVKRSASWFENGRRFAWRRFVVRRFPAVHYQQSGLPITREKSKLVGSVGIGSPVGRVTHVVR